MKTTRFLNLFCAAFLGITGQIYALESNLNVISQAEVNAWQAYYQKDLSSLNSNINKIFELQFGLSVAQAQEVTGYYAKAAVLFAALPHSTTNSDYQKLVLPSLVKAYATLNSFFHLKDYEDAAKYDLQWWIDRRSPATNNPTIVGQSMAKMYAAMYSNVNESDLERAAYLRAVAAQYRDLSQEKWGGITTQDWAVVEHMLRRSYLILLGK